MRTQPGTLSAIDVVVMAAYVIGIVILGAYFVRRSRTLESFTVGGRGMPGWALGLSVLATYLSSISFLANPGKSYASNWSPFVFSLTLPFACWISSRYFIPLYRGRLQTTAYEHLERRFGYWARAYAGTSLILLQIGRIGVVLYLVSLAIQELTGWHIVPVLIVLGCLTILYTVMGGIEGVVWTDVVQAIVLMGGALACCALLMARMPTGLDQAFALATEQGKFSFGGGEFNLIIEGFWVVFIFGFIDNLRNFGIDQNFVQRFLAAKSDREARKSLWLGGLLYLPVSALFFLIGTLLFVYYQTLSPAASNLPEAGDQVFPFFIVTELPPGLTGLVIAAVLAAGMSTLDSSLNVSATVYVVDFHRRLIRRDADERRLLRLTRITTAAVGVVGTAAGLMMITEKTVLDRWWKLSGIFGGAMLGVFLLGILVPRATARSALLGVIAGIIVIAWGTLCQGIEGGAAWLNFPLHPFLVGPLGTVAILTVGWADSLVAARGGQRSTLPES
jgi:SSS family solute:Na+ symporter